MDFVQPAPADDHAARLAETQRLLEQLNRLEKRARILLAEHRHVVATISDVQRQLEDAIPVPPAARPPQQ